jgi:integrase
VAASVRTVRGWWASARTVARAGQAAGLRDGRLHDARHTAGTILLILGVPDTVVDAIMGWEPGQSARMRRRYQHLTNHVLKGTADKVGMLLWTRPDQRPPAV